MTDAWSDSKRRIITNLCVNCKLGTTFLSSKETNDDAHTGEYIFEYVNECIKEVEEENVVQIVTDNASNNMAAANLLSIFKGVIRKAKSFTIFIYAHHKTLALTRKFTKREIVRPRLTRFATFFLTLQSLLDKKQELRNMMTSNEWDNTKWSKSKKGKEALDIVVPNDFWILIDLCLRVFTPLVKVLRLVDGEEKPSMGFVYRELLKTKDVIIKTLKRESDNMPILNIIDFFSDAQMQHHVINVELQRYTQKEGAFGRKLAACGCENNTSSYNPVSWWDFYGNETPNLKLMAKRILGLTTSSSGCTHQEEETLRCHKDENLVYVQFNARLMKKKKMKDKLETLLASNATNTQSWIVDGCDDEEEVDNILPSTRDNRNSQVEIREPDEDDFVSDGTEDDLNEEEEIELESDKELD
ncbi:uncharacterized protein LOC111400579 [Olea europaea var. sylvestris]|uniref:uncharacterized protein LOC111400579 n=1 Tax=Olea europaea var. sylvestris TaxID=158386 RepID=UPI000C1D0CC7|nr:uncharacterized protein LOC111400579 [Olea europaea var. sylvestris]